LDEYYIGFIVDLVVRLIIGLRILIMNNTWIYYWMMYIAWSLLFGWVVDIEWNYY